MKKILFITPWIPYPLDSGGAQAFYNAIEAIRKEYDVSILLNCHHSVEDSNIHDLKEKWPNVTFYCYEEKEDYSTLPFLPRLRRNLMYKWQKSLGRKIARLDKRYRPHDDSISGFLRYNNLLRVKSNDFTPGFCEYINMVCQKGFDLIQIEFYEYLQAVHLVPSNIPTCFVLHELRYIHVENELALIHNVSAEERLLFQKLKDEELSQISHFNHLITLTETDKNIISRLLPSLNIYVSPAISNTLLTAQDNIMPFKACHDIVFIGGSNHIPNVEGVLWFCKEVMPILEAKKYTGKFFIVGSWHDNFDNKVKALCPNVEFMGYVDSLMPFINGKISIVPIRIGGGMRIKILDSLAASSPIVSTEKGCEGLPVCDGKDIVIRDDSESFAEAILRLSSDIAYQKHLSENGTAILQGALNPENLIKRRMDFYHTILK